jgi:hypothetical protein
MRHGADVVREPTNRLTHHPRDQPRGTTHLAADRNRDRDRAVLDSPYVPGRYVPNAQTKPSGSRAEKSREP